MHDRLERLRRKLAATDDPDDRADLEVAIAALEEKIGATAPAPIAGDRITVGDLKQVTGLAVGAGATARVYIDGRQGKTNDELLAAYYQRLAKRCQAMPLQGVYEQRTTRDSLEVDIDRVYTQLATTATTDRERLEGASLARFDAAAFLAEHTGASLLPATQRTTFRVQGSAREQQRDAAPEGARFDKQPELAGMAADALARYTQEATGLTFLGPQLVSEAIAAAPRMVLLGEPGSGKSTALRYLVLST